MPDKDKIDFERLQLEIRNKLAQEHNWDKQEKHWNFQQYYWITAVALLSVGLILNFFKDKI